MRQHRERMRETRTRIDTKTTVPGANGLASWIQSEWHRSDEWRSVTDALVEACRLHPNGSRTPDDARRILRLHWCVDIDREIQPRQVRQERLTRIYTPGQRREAVRLYRDTALSVAEIASQLDLPRKTVQSWVRRDMEAA
jgi:DNA-directed RNA polymerase specialized sigma24 family protein